jgi:hypothetical protein
MARISESATVFLALTWAGAHAPFRAFRESASKDP